MMDRPPCPCEICTHARRAETRRLLGHPGAGDVAAVVAAILLPALCIIGLVAAWMVWR